MFNKKTIRSLCSIVLATTIISICLNGSTTQKDLSAQASAIPLATPISTLAITETAHDSILSSVASDMDDNGNQIYVWAFTDSTSGSVCNGIRYQKFQMSGLPLTDKTNVISSCSPISNDHQYLNPSVAMDRAGNFLVAWTDFDSPSTINVKMQAFKSNNTTVGNAVIVEDPSSTMASTAGVKIALNKNDNISSMRFGLTWLGCGTTPTCGVARPEVRAQIYTVNFNATLEPVRVNLNNLILNTAPYEASGEQVIAFSNDNFLIAWAGYYQTDVDANWAIFGRAITIGGNASTNIFQLTSFSTREYNPSLAAVVRPIPTLDTSDAFYLSFATNYQGSNNDIYAEKIICSGATLNCASTTRVNGDPIFVRANTTTSNVESLSTIRAFSNSNNTDKTYGEENSSSDYLNITWCSFDSVTETSKVYSQNFKNSLSRAGTEIAIDTLPGSNCTTPSVAIDEDSNYSASYVNQNADQIISKIYQSLYLRIGAETLTHAPDSDTTEGNPRTALNSNGNYVITYERTNSDTGFKDIIYALYDKNGNAIQNTSIANSGTVGDHDSQDVAFFTDASTSPDYGKFIITWHFDNGVGGRGIYYQLFNADGSKLDAATVVTTEQSNLPKVSAGKFKQFLIAYRNTVGSGEVTTNRIQYLYQNGGSAITGTANDSNSISIGAPFVTLSPDADGTTGIGGNSKFVIVWNNGNIHNFKEGFLDSSSSVSLGTVQSGNVKVHDVSSAIVPDLGTLSPPKNTFIYVFITINADFLTQIHPYTYGDGLLLGQPIDLGTELPNPRIAIDKATGNFLISWDGFNNFTNQLNTSQILMFTKDSNTIFNLGDSITGNSSGATADIATDSDFLNHYYYYLSNATGPFTIGESLSTNLDIPIAASTPGVNLYFGYDISTNFFVGQNLMGQMSGTTGVVEAVYSDYIFVKNVLGNFMVGETVVPFGLDMIQSTEAAYLLDLTPNFTLPYIIGESLNNFTNGATGTVRNISAPFVNISQLVGSFNTNDVIRTSTIVGTFTPDILGVVKAQFYRLNFALPGDNTTWITKFGPEFSPNTHFNYGQYLASPDIDFDSRSSEDDSRLAIFAYSISSDNTYLDNNGILQQRIEDPFSVGRREDLSPLADQQITPGGKYIVVPQLIDFGNIGRGETSSVNFSDLTMPDASSGRLEVTDLDGTDFDLTVSLSTLTNTTLPTATIPSSNFIIENNDGTDLGGSNPGVTTTYSFTNVNDVTLDPSTSPGENANLSTTQTLLRKNNNNTGVWRIKPRVSLTIANDAPNGLYSGTITFTLI